MMIMMTGKTIKLTLRVINQLFRIFWKYVRHNSAASDAFDEVMKVMNYIGLWNIELARYSPNITCRICLYGLECSLRTHALRLIWPSLIVDILAAWAKFLYLVTVWWSTASSPFTQQMFLLPRRYGRVRIRIRMCYTFICTAFKIAHGVKQCPKCQRINYHDTTNHRGYLAWTALLWSRDILTVK